MRYCALVLVLLGCFWIAPAASAGSSAPTSTATLESALVREINGLRRARGLTGLQLSPSFSRAAASHSAAMLTAGFFAHESADGSAFSARIRGFVKGRWSVGENLAMFGPSRPSAGDIVSLWLASPPHRANLLSPRWRALGVAVRFSPRAGGAYGGLPTWVVTLDLGARG